MMVFKFLIICLLISLIIYVESSDNKNIRFAICMTGQLIRLELGSKIKNLINSNLIEGFHVSFFIFLDNDFAHIKAVKAKDRVSTKNALYIKFNNKTLDTLIRSKITQENKAYENFNLYIRLEPPPQNKFLVRLLIIFTERI